MGGLARDFATINRLALLVVIFTHLVNVKLNLESLVFVLFALYKKLNQRNMLRDWFLGGSETKRFFRKRNFIIVR